MTVYHREKIKLSKDFYRDYYRSLLSKLLYSVLLIIVLIAAIMYEVRTRPEPDYYATSSDGALVSLNPIVPSTIKTQ